MKDCCGHDIVPIQKTLTIHTNRHPNSDGTSWGWIEGCDGRFNICWSDNKFFNYDKASEFVSSHNTNNKNTQ